MAVVTKYGPGYQDPDKLTLPAAINAGGVKPNVLIGDVAIANGDSATSVVYVGKVPSSAIFVPELCALTHTAITGLTDLNAGFTENVDALADGLDVSSAGAKSLLAAVSTANLAKRAWQIAGLASDPKRPLTVMLTLNAAAAAAGTLSWRFGFVNEV